MQPTKVVWVTVEASGDKRTFYVSDQEPGTTGYRDVSKESGLQPPAFSTYADLCTHLRSIGFDPPPEEHFAPNPRESNYQRTQWTRTVPPEKS